MLIEPSVRGSVFLNAHPAGCAKETERQIDYVRARAGAYAGLAGPKAVLVLGCSAGYGLASRIAAAFGFGAATVGVSLERPPQGGPQGGRTGTPGWYANRAFDRAAREAGLASRSVDADAFAPEAKELVVAAARELGLRFDLVVYSIAAPARTDPATGESYRSVIKPIGSVYRGATVDPFTGELSEAEVRPASEREIEATVKVMGGEDWELWIEALRRGGVLAEGATTAAYSYVGPPFSWPIYRDGTIGRAKAHLEATARRMAFAAPDGLKAYLSVNKAVVTRASAVIPAISLYIATLYKVMKERSVHEDCVAQADRLFRERLYAGGPPELDAEGRIRLDDLEMGQAVQAEVDRRMARIGPGNLRELADVEGYRSDFLRAHGFGVEGVDYGAEVEPDWDPARA